ncbi:hypothetical protein P4O66_000062 [Electrophorus voltai]|uniref:Uncharacterized protein n=1 Tax=Electrophorus voltai TaxID=2609070 RepID=A0AAD8ZWC0_9TELE|nr:hypothetical protein P4O66_000062 [Electrophorus voltai]
MDPRNGYLDPHYRLRWHLTSKSTNSVGGERKTSGPNKPTQPWLSGFSRPGQAPCLGIFPTSVPLVEHSRPPAARGMGDGAGSEALMEAIQQAVQAEPLSCPGQAGRRISRSPRTSDLCKPLTCTRQLSGLRALLKHILGGVGQERKQ